MRAEEAAFRSRALWASLPHRPGASIVVQLLWRPAAGLIVSVAGTGLDDDLGGIISALSWSHELDPVDDDTGRDLTVPFAAAQIATLARPVLRVDPDSVHPWMVGDYAEDFDDARRLVEALQRQSTPVCVRVVVTPTDLSTGEEDAIVSSLSDPDATTLTRLIRRAEGASTRAPTLFGLRPPFEVGVFVATPTAIPWGVAGTLASTLSPPASAGRAGAAPSIELHAPDDDAVAGYHRCVMPSRASDKNRLSRLFGPASLHTTVRLPYATSPTYPTLRVTTSRWLDRAESDASATGVCVGSARTGTRWAPVEVSDDDLSRHLAITAQTGTGKSRLMEDLAMQEAQRHGFAFVDPHGDSVDRLMRRLPRHRRSDAVVIDPSVPEHRPAINPLHAVTDSAATFVVQDLAEMFYTLFDPARSGIVGPRFEAWLRLGALTLLDAAAHDGPPASLVEIPRLFSDDGFRRDRLRFVTDEHLLGFWAHEIDRMSDYHRSEMLGWFSSKFDRFTSNPIMRAMIGSGRDDLDLPGLMDDGAIVLVRLSKGLIGEVNSALLGYVLTSRLWVAALTRCARPETDRTSFTMFIDEFHSFVAASTSLATMLSEARKFGLRAVLANQFQAQLPPVVSAAIDGNVGNRITFRVGAADAAALAPLYRGAFDAHDLANLANLTAAAVLLDGGEVQPPFTLRTAPR